jgi:hypothetical protein
MPGGGGSVSSNRWFTNTPPPAQECYSWYPYGEDRNLARELREDAPGWAAEGNPLCR